MFRRCTKRLAGVADFVDVSYLRNQRPRVPGGGWKEEHLRVKSTADLQIIWFTLLRERDMLYSMKEHYQRHPEELGALPAPSRIDFVEDSMRNLRKVMMERDAEAADEATQMFKDRIAHGIYSYPPGPQRSDAALRKSVSEVRLVLSKQVDEARLRELLGRFDVFENHRGIAELTVQMAPETADRKKAAEEAFEDWYWATDDFRQYAVANGDGPSYFDDNVAVELTPGEFLDDAVVAAQLPVPPPKEDDAPAATPLDRIRRADRNHMERQVIQLGYFPVVTSEAPAEPGARPQHPDEIEGPYEVKILYGMPGGKEYIDSLELSTIDGAQVLSVEDTTDAWLAAHPPNTLTPEYAEAIGQDKANTEHLKNWPMVPKWKKEYEKLAMAEPAEIMMYNFSNTSEYVDREALLTNQSVWESPLPIDPSCGRAHRIPPHAEPPKEFIPKEPLVGTEY